MPPQTNLQPGMTGPEVKKLQDFLVSKGYLTQAQVNTGPGNYGPQTTAAVKAYQQATGVDTSKGGSGYWGPLTRAASSGGATSGSSPYTPEEYAKAIAEHPIGSQYIAQGNTAQDIENAGTTGDLSTLKNHAGKPFTIEEQQSALKQAEEDNKAYYEQLKTKETEDVKSSLAQKQADYQNYLLTSGQNFQEEKTAADQSAANTGVLFSGGRAQKEQTMQNKYAQDQAYKQATLGRDIGATAQDYQYKYGNQAAKNLSKYYQLGGNTYNANVATGGVGTSPLSSVYNPKATTYGGTRLAESASTANKRAAGLLANKANKLLSTGYTNKL